MRPLAALVASALLAACGSNPQQLTAAEAMSPVSPEGTVSGAVLDSALTPLSGVDVELLAGSKAMSATSGADGSFTFASVPAGAEGLLTLKKGGYAQARTDVTVPDAAGQFPLAHGNARVGPVELAKLDGKVSFLVIDSTGRPVTGAPAVLDASPTAKVFDGTVLSAVSVTASVGNDGSLDFAGVPSPVELSRFQGTYTLSIGPVDTNGDGVPDLGGYQQQFQASTLVADSSPRVVTLTPTIAGSGSGLNVVAGNAGSMFGSTAPNSNLIPPSDPVRLVFNKPLRAQSVLAQLTDENGDALLENTVTVTGGGTILEIAPNKATTPGQEYNLRLRVSALTGETFSKTGFFFAGDPAQPVAIGINQGLYQVTADEAANPPPYLLQPGDVVYVQFNQVIAETSSETPVEVFFNNDINLDGKVGGDTVGEVGNSTGRGFPLQPAEPTAPIPTTVPPATPVFPLTMSGWTTRYSFVYPQSCGATNGPCEALDPSKIQLTVKFSDLAQRTSDIYQTAWAVPITTDLLVPSWTPLLPPSSGNGS